MSIESIPNELSAVKWCSLCNSKPANGTLTIEDPITKEEVPVPACLKCVKELDWSHVEKGQRP